MARYGFTDVDPNKLKSDITLSTKDAMDLLGSERKYYIAYARWTGVRIIREKEEKRRALEAELQGMKAGQSVVPLTSETFVAMEARRHQVKSELTQLVPTVHSREVRARMAEEGVLDGYNGADFWLGTVFNSGPWEPTGERYKYSDVDRNIHDREVRVWRLKPGAAADAYVEPAKPEQIRKRQDAYRAQAQKHAGK